MSAAVCTGHLREAKKHFESIEGEKGFIALKLWLRASFRLGGYEESFKTLVKREKKKENETLELEWIR